MSVANNRRYQNNHQQQRYQNGPRTNYNAVTSNTVVYNVVAELQDYMFTGDNLKRFNKHNFGLIGLDAKKQNRDNREKFVSSNAEKEKEKEKGKDKPKDDIYKPLQTDSLFWCFYILKYGLSKYEMEVGNQHFPIEKAEKFKYIELFRTKKDILKINKIKPLADLESDLANSQRISIKTFFALCIVEKINVLLVDKRKIYESITNDEGKVNIVKRNGVTYEHHIEYNVLNESEKLANYRDTYYKVQGFDASLKSMTGYKVDELLELCGKFGIDISVSGNTKKMAKKDIYELLVQNF